MNALKFCAAGAAALTLAAASLAHADTLSNTPSGGNISPFGYDDSQTYGQVFSAPITGVLDDFTLYLNGAIGGQLYGGVGVWNCGASYAFSCGVSATLYESAPVDADHAGGYTFSPGISVVAGGVYVAYLSVFGLNHDGQGTTSMPLANDAPGINYFVWNNSSSPHDASWNYFFDTGDAQFNANFSGAVPEPASWAMMLLGFGGLGAALRTRRRTALA